MDGGRILKQVNSECYDLDVLHCILMHVIVARVALDWVCHPARSGYYLERLAYHDGTLGIRHQPRRAACGRGTVRSSCHLIISAPAQIGRSAPPKPEAEIQAEIRNILKQIVSTVTFLPVIDEPTVFNILAYTSESADIPADEWLDSDPLAIEAGKSQQVKLRSFSTDVHRIEAMVAYRYEG